MAFIVSVYGDVSHLSYDLQQHPLLSNLVEFEIEPQYLEYIPPSLISAASLGNGMMYLSFVVCLKKRRKQTVPQKEDKT